MGKSGLPSYVTVCKPGGKPYYYLQRRGYCHVRLPDPDAEPAQFAREYSAGLEKLGLVKKIKPTKPVKPPTSPKAPKAPKAPKPVKPSAPSHHAPKAAATQPRTCLACGRVFESEGAHNRICLTCKKHREIY